MMAMAKPPGIFLPPLPDVRPAAVAPLAAVLGELAEVVATLSDAEYVQKPVGVVSSSVGGHVRHNLDHVEALLAGLAEGRIDYDRRQRGTEVERSRTAALEAIRRLRADLLGRAWGPGDRALRLSVLVAPDAPPVEVPSSLEREAAFVLSHTIHHNSLIAVMVRLLGRPVPATFGYAPSTVAHQKANTCVR
jgi:uncharacterized damage-inducible protein DinB